MSDLYFNEANEQNTCNNEDLRSTILQPFQFEPEQKKRVVMRVMRKKLQKLFTDILENRCS